MKYILPINRSSFFNRLAYVSLLGSGAYILLLWSPNILGNLLSRYTKSLMFIFPWLMLWLAYSWQVVANRDHRWEILLIISIIILGIINVPLSDSPSKSLTPMRNFLLTGIFALWASMFLFTDQRRRREFDWFCAGALAVILPVEIIVWWVHGNYGPKVFQIFTLHPIPLGTVIILLSPGPVRLIATKNFLARLLGCLLVLLGGLLIFLTHKRGAWLALAAILLVGIIYLVRRRRFLILTLLLLIALLLPLETRRQMARLDPNIPRYVSVLHRMELYPFALHIWRIHPFMGIGLRAFNHENYLADYQLRNKALGDFPKRIVTLQTFDNTLLTGLVELGTVMTLFYFMLITLILVKYCRSVRSSPESSPLDWYRVLVLLGFAIHSLTYDSLLVPPVNWLFHVQMGILAGYQASGGARLSHQPGPTELSEV
jgi:O-antigen ligase